MSKLRISSKRLNGLSRIAELRDEEVKELFSAMATYPLCLYPTDEGIFRKISDQITTIEDKDALLILDTLLSLQHALSSSNKSINMFIGDVATSLADQAQSGESLLKEEQLPQLQITLEQLLRVPSVSLAAKATSLLFENERSLLNSRILTDVRPVFDVATNDVGGGLIIQTLKLEYVSEADNHPKEFFVSLDSDDIEDLINNLERAKLKADKLKELLSESSITCIDTDES